ncbi:MAG: nucleoside-diphosphate kinase [Elusimicrobia bacterium RIFOXYB2_FULL_48_7]|nr:MAG: nucleoside-diphosphate kinase [Elusimicrobia bacterium RIFOXYB2_FULL_48_7]
MERTCIIIKPDGLGKKTVGKVIDRFEGEGFKLLGLKMVKPTRAEFENFYGVHRGKEFFSAFIDFVTSMPVIVSVWEAEDAIKRARGIIGATDSKKAEKGTLRNLYGTNERHNLIHASDSAENAMKEILRFFKTCEILEYNENDWK